MALKDWKHQGGRIWQQKNQSCEYRGIEIQHRTYPKEEYWVIIYFYRNSKEVPYKNNITKFQNSLSATKFTKEYMNKH